jgi:hypothetical protein
MVGGTSGTGWDVEDDHSALRMGHFFYVHPETDCLKQFFCHGDRISKGSGTHHRAGRLVSNTQKQVTSAFVGYRNAVLAKLAVVQLGLGFLELQALRL